MPGKARCKDGGKHDWKKEKTREGMTYQKCTKCGEVQLLKAGR